MQIIVKSRHTVLPKKIKELATAKFEKLEKLLDKIQTLEITIGEDHNPRISDKHHIEVTLLTKNRRLHATASGPDTLSALDRAIDKVETQLRKVKSKTVSRRNGHAATTVVKTAPAKRASEAG